MFSEQDLLPISALQHLAFCERQCALIHIEKIWQENRLTVEGNQLHERTHKPDTESRGDIRIARGLRLRSLQWGLAGQADVVEFHRLTSSESRFSTDSAITPEEVELPNLDGLWRPLPIEYKRGKPKSNRCDEIQLCAQTLCLEEMLTVTIPVGALYYGRPRRRTTVHFDVELRSITQEATAKLHALVESGTTPQAAYSKKCDNCSLTDTCLPKTTAGRRSAARYLARSISRIYTAEDAEDYAK